MSVMRTINDIQYISPWLSWQRPLYIDRPGDIEYLAYMDEMTERRKPLEQLTPEFDPLLTKSPPKLCYGFVVEVDRLLEYALAEDVLPEDFKPKSRYTALPYVLDRLNELTGTRLRLCEPWLRVGDQFVLTIYTNYSMHRKHYPDDYDELIVEVIQEELGIEERPMWHWDASCAS